MVLSAHIRIENRGDENVTEQVVSLTVPTDISNQQKVLSISVPGQTALKIFDHPNQVDKFITFRSSVPAHTAQEHTAQFRVRLSRFDYKQLRGNESAAGNSNFLRSTTYVESTSSEIVDLAKKIATTHSGEEARLWAAYRYPQQNLKYQLIENRGAIFALRNGFGDCTEYAAVFAALARAMGYPARLTSEFNFSEDGTFDQPNHHAAEVFMGGQWIPVDPNLGTDKKSDYGFGTTGLHKIVLKRDGSWVWATSSRGVSKAYREANLDVRLRWFIQNQ
jgi:transglutaminase-like putative cysteine protease